MILEKLVVGPIQCNCYILGCEATREALVIDPGDDIDLILAALKKHNLQLKAIFCTHAHMDHVGGLAKLKAKTGARAMMQEEDLSFYQNLATQAAWMGLPAPGVTEIDELLRDGMTVSFGNYSGQVVSTPGHTRGSCCLHLPGSPDWFFSGDTLFQGSVGRTDLWGGSYEELINSIQRKILPLDDSVRVLPGHGPETTIGMEKRYNPFLQSRIV
jgi:hydroxyacylglutathione hydrolase